MKSKVNSEVQKQFEILFEEGDVKHGKNLLAYEVAKRNINNLLKLEEKWLKGGDAVRVLQLEQKYDRTISNARLPFDVKIAGEVDRIEERNGKIRIIDYKTGKVDQGKVEITDWEALTTDYDKYSKSFQVLCYAYMMQKYGTIKLPVEAGIISFKNLNAGFLKFGKKESAFSRKKEQLVTEETLESFTVELKNLILEICNINIPFIEKDV
jgi:hypothetical protein